MRPFPKVDVAEAVRRLRHLLLPLLSSGIHSTFESGSHLRAAETRQPKNRKRETNSSSGVRTGA